jgi:DNA-binding NarL/FixJ family response regulator
MPVADVTSKPKAKSGNKWYHGLCPWGSTRRESKVSLYRIVLADDHLLIREGLKRILREDASMEVIGEAGDGLELLNLLKQSKLLPHMAIVDISMPNLSGIEATRQIKMIYPDIKILILSMHKDQEYLSHALSTGADGYLLKEDSDRELFKAIEMIRQGRVYISPLLPPSR